MKASEFDNTVFAAMGTTPFVDDLAAYNRLERFGFVRFVFFPGMLFDTRQSWWGQGRFRPETHEGVDLCLFESAGGAIRRLDDTIGVPAAFAGRVVRIMDDFMGKTVVVAHAPENRSGARRLTLYAHIRPDDQLAVGDDLTVGAVFARIAPVRSTKTPLPPHLHLSFARQAALPPIDELEWPVLNRVDRRAFYDPLPVLGCDYRLMDYFPALKNFDAFSPVGA